MTATGTNDQDDATLARRALPGLQWQGLLAAKQSRFKLARISRVLSHGRGVQQAEYEA